MKKRPVIVTGCGRSGTHWLGGVMQAVLGDGAAAHEPAEYWRVTDVAVDSRLRWKVDELAFHRHRILHLVRDGRDVVRSLHTWHAEHHAESWETCCQQWAEAVDIMLPYPVIRLEDLTARADARPVHTMPHWTGWDKETADTFWRLCGRQMEDMGYGGRA